MQKNKFTTYLLYTIGEIVLVVIGILIALSINNWNTSQKNKALEKELLRQMVSELRSDLLMLTEAKRYSQWALESGNYIMKAIREQRSMNDSLAKNFSRTTIPFLFFSPRTSTYDNFTAIGFHFISNKDLRSKIQGLYSEFELTLRGQNTVQQEFLNTINMFSLQHLDQSNNNYPFDWNGLKENKYFFNLIANYVEVHGHMFEAYEGSEKKVVQLIDAIEVEIKK